MRLSILLREVGQKYPIYSTTSFVDGRTARRASFNGALGACVLPPIAGFILAMASWLLPTEGSGNISNFLADMASVIEGLAMILIVSVGFSLFGALPGYVLCMLAIRSGKAGWLVAMTTGALVSIATFYSAVFLGFSMQGQPAEVGLVTGSVFGTVFWLSARLTTPRAFIGEVARIGEANASDAGQ